MQEPIKNSDEIDLIELFMALWKKKWTIFLITLLFAIAGVVYALLAPQKWVSSTQITEPRYSQLANYISLMRENAISQGSDLPSAQNISKDLFSDLIVAIKNIDLRREFLLQSLLYRRALESEKVQEGSKEAQNLLSELLRETIVLSLPSTDTNRKNDDILFPTISLKAPTPEMAHDTLMAYMQYVNQKAFDLKKEDILSLLQDQLSEYALRLSIMESDLKLAKAYQIQNLERANEIASKAGIEGVVPLTGTDSTTINNFSAPYLAMSDAKVPISDSKSGDSPYLYMLGTKNLSAQLKIIKAEDLPYPPGYYQTKRKQEMLEKVFYDLKEMKDAKMYRAISSPDYPDKKEGSRRGIIITLFIITGLIFSLFIVFCNKWVSGNIKA